MKRLPICVPATACAAPRSRKASRRSRRSGRLNSNGVVLFGVVWLLADEHHGVGNARARSAVAVDPVLAIGKPERDPAHHAAVVSQAKMPADHTGMARQGRLRNGAETER